MSTIKNYLSLVKFSHTIFALPFAMIGFFLAIQTHVINFEGQSNLNNSTGWGIDFARFATWEIITIKFFLVLVCMVTARSAAMAFNRWLDKNFDAKNPRTAIREIPAGIISADKALRFVIINCVVFIVATYFINRICFILSPVALFVILFYSYTKRFTALCHLVLGLGLSLAPIGAYLAVAGRFDVVPVLFSLAVLFWVSGFDIIYALQDEEFDKSHDLYSIPAKLGKPKALRVSELLHVVSGAMIILAGWVGAFGIFYWIGCMVFIGMLIYQHSVVKPHDLRKVNLAFMTANGIASIVFAVFVIADLFLISGLGLS
jgi:4-hydroxybenzoate polyprenyltransferase